MSTPMSADAWLNALRIEGITKIVQLPGWKTHNRDGATGKAFGPVHGVLIHHTAGRDSKNLVVKGTNALPGPLCHDLLAKDGTLYLVGHGRTNHAGSCTPAVRDAVIAEKTPVASMRNGTESVDANDFLYGLEIENLGDGKDPYPAAQYDVAVRWAAARLRFHGWSANSAWGHKELTTRKIDPSFPMAQFRKDVEARLSGPRPAPVTPPKTTTPPKENSAMSLTKADLIAVTTDILTRDGIVAAPASDPNAKTNEFWQLRSHITSTTNNTLKILAQLQKQNEVMQGMLTALMELADKVESK